MTETTEDWKKLLVASIKKFDEYLEYLEEKIKNETSEENIKCLENNISKYQEYKRHYEHYIKK